MPLPPPPERLPIDYIEMVYLVVFFMVGGPINLGACTELHRRPTASRLDLLKRHLNYTDLLMLFLYTPSRICHLITYSWRGGDLMCRAIKFAHGLTFEASSIIIVCISLDRLFCVVLPVSSTRATLRTQMLLAVGWMLSALLCLPQLVTWQVASPFSDKKWEQCLSIWHIQRFKDLTVRDTSLSNSTVPNMPVIMANIYNATGNVSFTNVNSDLSLTSEPSSSYETMYSWYHFLCVFWVPFVIIFLSYITISAWVWRNTRFTDSQDLNQAQSLAKSLLQKTPASAHFYLPTSSATPPRIIVSIAEEDENNEELHGTELIAQPPMPLPRQKSSSSPRQISFYSQSINGRFGKASRKAMEGLTSTSNNNGSKYVSTDKGNAAGRRVTIDSRHSQVDNMKRKTMRVSMLLVLAYVVCWLPYNTFGLWSLIAPADYALYSDHWYGLHGLIVFNSVINPFLYGMFHKLSFISHK